MGSGTLIFSFKTSQDSWSSERTDGTIFAKQLRSASSFVALVCVCAAIDTIAIGKSASSVEEIGEGHSTREGEGVGMQGLRGRVGSYGRTIASGGDSGEDKRGGQVRKGKE